MDFGNLYLERKHKALCILGWGNPNSLDTRGIPVWARQSQSNMTACRLGSKLRKVQLTDLKSLHRLIHYIVTLEINLLRHLTSLTQILAQEKIFPFLQGRHAVARRPIKCGTPIGLESPIVSSLYPEKLMTNCSGCFKAVVIPVPCRGCAAYLFCSRDCRLKKLCREEKEEHEYT